MRRDNDAKGDLMRNAMLLSVVLIGVGATSGSADAALLGKLQVKGNQVGTFFFGSTAITCADPSRDGTLSVDGSLLGSEGVVKAQGQKRETTNTVVINVTITDSCTGVTQFGTATIEGGFTPPNNTLASAAMDGSAVLEDAFGQPLPYTVAVDVTVTGQGPVTSWRSVNHSQSVGGPDTIIASYSKSSNATRYGSAAGTITVNGITLTPTFVETTLMLNGVGQVVLEK